MGKEGEHTLAVTTDTGIPTVSTVTTKCNRRRPRDGNGEWERRVRRWECQRCVNYKRVTDTCHHKSDVKKGEEES